MFGPGIGFLFASYGQNLAERHATFCRDLITHEWYQERWGDQVLIARGGIERFDLTGRGYRMATSTSGRATGFGGHIVVADDPHNTQEVESEVVRDGVVRWWTESMPTRVNNFKTASFVVVMQRQHEGDLSGWIIANDPEYVNIVLPMEYDPTRSFFYPPSLEGRYTGDIRTEEGELLWPTRIGPEELRSLKASFANNPYAISGQLQQYPVPRGGGIIKEEWWQTWGDETNPKDWRNREFPIFEYVFGSLDTALTEDEENDFSALSVWGTFRDKDNIPKVMLIYCWQDHLAINDLVLKVEETMRLYGGAALLIENKTAGHTVEQELRRLFKNSPWQIILRPVKGDKSARAHTCVPYFVNGVVYAPGKEWAWAMIKQLAQIPRGIHDDLADTCLQALIFLREIGLLILQNEALLAEAEREAYQPPAQALYSGL